MALHSTTPAASRHPVHRVSYASSSARTAADKSFTTDDLGIIAWQTDDDTFWFLKSVSGSAPTVTPTWVAVNSAGVADNAVTMAKIEDINQYVIIGRNDSGSGDPEKLTRDEVAAMLAGASGGTINQGTHTIWIPAVAMVSRTTSGAGSTTVESTTNKVMVSSLAFDTAAAEYAQFDVRMPKSWDEGTITAAFIWTANSTSTNSIVMGIQGVALSNDETIDAAFGTAQTVTDANTSTAYQVHISGATSAVTIAGSPAAEDWVKFQVYRDVSNGSDTLAVDALLLGVTLYVTINAATDA